MRFPKAGLIPVQWYFTDKPPLPFPHVYGSNNWINSDERPEYDDGTPGEVFGAARPWYSGRAPLLDPGPPQGSEAAFLGETPQAEGLKTPCGRWLFDFNSDYGADYDSATYFGYP